MVDTMLFLPTQGPLENAQSASRQLSTCGSTSFTLPHWLFLVIFDVFLACPQCIWVMFYDNYLKP